MLTFFFNIHVCCTIKWPFVDEIFLSCATRHRIRKLKYFQFDQVNQFKLDTNHRIRLRQRVDRKYLNYILRFLHGTTITVHRVNASPSYPEMQLHSALCLTTLQTAFSPHLPIHGSMQRSFIHALLLAHSAFDVHSGRQFGGLPT